MRALLLSDRRGVTDIIAGTLLHAGLALSVVAHASAAGAGFEDGYDLILFDAEEGGLECHRTLKLIRECGVSLPVIALSDCSEMSAVVRLLGLGADDYIALPFDESELLARMRAVVRRSCGPGNRFINTGPLKVNLDAKTVCVGKIPIRLTPKEFLMLELLSIRKGSTITKQMFVEYLYDGRDEPKVSIMELVMCRLRKKLSPALGEMGLIRTVRGGGYMLVDPNSTTR